LGPYPSLALFAVPVIILEPAKLLTACLIGTGHFFAGAAVFIAAEVLKLTPRRTAVSIKQEAAVDPALCLGYGYCRRMMDFLESTKAGRATRRMVIKAIDWVRALRSKLSGPFAHTQAGT
jgi:hypothetical protein